MKTASDRPVACPPINLETLENRLLQSANPTYDFGKLTGYGLTGHSWTYQVDYKIKSNVISDTSGSASGTITSSHKSGSGTMYKVTNSGVSGQTTTMTYQKTADGTNVVEINANFGGGKLVYHLSGARMAPRSMRLGDSDSDNGSFTGTFSGSSGNTKYSGSISGTTKTSIKLLKKESITVEAGTFNTVKGTCNVSLNGVLKMRLAGKTYSVDISANYPMTFWAVKDLGMVKTHGTFSTTLIADGEKATVSMNTTSRLQNYTPRTKNALFN